MAELTCIFESHNPRAPAIIFIHGLDGHVSQTWMQDSSDESTLWPKWLADDIDCSLYLVHYDAALSRWKDDAMPLAAQGDAFVHALSNEAGLENRPLILVGHSMGGLVIKTAIQSGLHKGVDSLKSVVNQIRGVVFVGTPHNGSQLATLATHASMLLSTNTQVKNMQTHDAYLRSLNQQFRAYCSKPPNGKVSVRSFIEMQGVFVGKKIWGIRFGPHVTIVDPNDGDAHIEGEIPVPLAENHISMCKLANRNKPLYKSLLRFLKKEVDLTLPPELLGAKNTKESEKATDIRKPDLSNQPQINPAVTTGAISAGEGGVAAGVIHGKVTINTK